MSHLTSRSLVILGAAVASVGCGISIPPAGHTLVMPTEPRELPKTIKEFERLGRGDSFRTTFAGKEVVIRPDHEPDLRLVVRSGTCPRLTQTGAEKVPCEHYEVSVPVADVTAIGKEITWRVTQSQQVRLSTDEVVSAQYVLNNWRKPGWRRTWGAGLSVGSAGGFGLRGDVLPASWLGLELGGIALPGAGHLFAGLRVRPVSISVFRPYLGGFASTYFAGSGDDKKTAPGEETPNPQAAVGARAGVDIDLDQFWTVCLEAAAAHPTGASRKWMGMEGRWVPWGGTALTYYF